MKNKIKNIMILTLVFVLAGCSSGSSGTEGEVKTDVIWAINGDQDTMDPQQNVTNSVILPQVYMSLLATNLDNKVSPSLATEWSVAEDQKTWTFKLREGVKFHDGSDFNSEDVVATFDRLLNEDNGLRYTSTYSYIESVKATSDFEVVITTKDVYGAFETDMTSPSLGIMSSDVLANLPDQFGTDVTTIVGTGPFRVTEWIMGEEMVLESFEDYFDGAAKTKKFTLRVIPEQNAREIGLENGEFDIASGISPDAVARYNSGQVEGTTVSINQGNGMHLFQFGLQGILDDVKLRQAINYGIDKEAIVNALFKENEEVAATAPVGPTVVGYQDLGVIKQDQDKARALMKEAGKEGGFSIKLMTTNVYNKGIEMGEIIKEQLAEIDIDVEIITVEKAVFSSMFGLTKDQLDYDMFIMGAGGNSEVGKALYRIWHTEDPVDGVQYNNNNYGFYSNARVDELLDLGAVTVDRDKADEIYTEAMKILWEEDPVGVFMNFRNNIYGVATGVTGFKTNAANTPDLLNVEVTK